MLRENAQVRIAAGVMLGLICTGVASAQEAAPTTLSVAESYVKVVGGVIAGLGSILGLPLVFQTYRKTQAEITKINLEAAKLAREAAGAHPGATPQSVVVQIDRGVGNTISITTDPRLRGPLLVLVDALIAGVFSTLASYAINLLPLPNIFTQPLRIAAYLVFFWPVLQAARRIKGELGRSDLLEKAGADRGAGGEDAHSGRDASG